MRTVTDADMQSLVRRAAAQGIASAGGPAVGMPAHVTNDQLDAIIRDEVVPSAAELIESAPETLEVEAPGLDALIDSTVLRFPQLGSDNPEP